MCYEPAFLDIKKLWLPHTLERLTAQRAQYRERAVGQGHTSLVTKEPAVPLPASSPAAPPGQHGGPPQANTKVDLA